MCFRKKRNSRPVFSFAAFIGMFSTSVCMPVDSWAESVSDGNLAVIVNPMVFEGPMTKQSVINLFMGRAKKVGKGQLAIPLENVNDEHIRDFFYTSLTGKSISEIRSYWARQVFSGRTSPPRAIDSFDEIKDIVKNNKGAIGYIPLSQVDKDVSIVYVIGND